jgi:hypothetical protein
MTAMEMDRLDWRTLCASASKREIKIFYMSGNNNIASGWLHGGFVGDRHEFFTEQREINERPNPERWINT